MALAQARIVPNIVPADNLRLPDALTIKHGPAPLLARFILESDKAARERGIRLRIRHDFDELMYLNKQHVALGNWLNTSDALNPAFCDLNPENAFWLSGENADGEVVSTHAARIHDWTGTNLEEQVRVAWYGRDLGQEVIVTADAAKVITGVVYFAAAAWVRPDYRGRHLSYSLPRVAKAYACARWPLDWAVGFISRTNIEKGLARNLGQKNLSFGVTYPDSDWGEFAVVYTGVNDVYRDLASFLSTGLSVADEAEIESLFSTSLAQPVTNTSSEGVFHGSSSRS